MKTNAINLAERRILPDWLVRKGIQGLMGKKLKEQNSLYEPDSSIRKLSWVQSMDQSPLAYFSSKPNAQHYEVPPQFFKEVLGPRMKYSSCLWESGTTDLREAENQMLNLTTKRSRIKDGMRVLDLGCGWGSFSLYIAENFPNCKIVSVSNSKDQGNYIEEKCRSLGLKNVSHIKADMNEFDTDLLFDRVVSIEMFEHMRNYRLLLRNIARWLTDSGQVFLHFFCHRDYAYPYEINGDSDWMTRYFFTGGMMPSYDLLEYFQDDLVLKENWKVNGYHYEKTCRTWLNNQDNSRHIIMDIFRNFYGEKANLWYNRWRIFWMACEELFAYNCGKEWFVGHFIMEKKL